MRLLLSIIFFFFALLISLENIIYELTTGVKKVYILFHKNIKKILAKSTKRAKTTRRKPSRYTLPTVHFLQNVKRFKLSIPHRRKKRRLSLRFNLFGLKLKYFLFGLLFSFFFLFLPMVIIIFLQDLPSPASLAFRQIPQTSKIYDRNGTLLSEIYSTQNRTIISLSDVPLNLQHATLAIEDKNFYKHPGFDIPAILRAFREITTHHNTQGGSTITQQLIKSSILTPEQSISRKAKELVLAFWAERMYTKNQILEMYFNQVPYGGTAWGIEAAAETYFSKPVKQLDLAQSAFLAGLTQAPTYYSPYGAHPTVWKDRQKEVLKRMVAVGYISQKQADAAAKEKLHFQQQQIALHAPHFIDYVKEFLIEKYGIGAVERGGLIVRTSLDLKKQEMAEKSVTEEIAGDGYLDISNGAALITDPQNGDILAMVGSHDFNDSEDGNVNIATSLRQPGSSIKVVTYTGALMHGVTAASTIDDSPVSYPSGGGPYAPVNYDGKFHGRVTIRTALSNSLNIPAVKLLDQISVPTMVNLAKNMGVSSWGDADQYGLSLTLGAAEVTMLDMAHVYGTLAHQGIREDLNPILKITDAKGNILEQKNKPIGLKVIDPGVAYIMSDILADNNARSMEFGPNSPLYVPGHYVSVKTGTTDSKRDNWTDGYTDKYVVIVWVGNNDNHPMSQALASGITGAAPIWHRIMGNLVEGTATPQPTPPVNIITRSCGGKNEYFLLGTDASLNCGVIPSSTANNQR
jgi:penicillin-binding protein 1C